MTCKKLQSILLYFSKILVSQVLVQKYLGIVLDTRFNFEDQIKEVIKKTIKSIGRLKKF